MGKTKIVPGNIEFESVNKKKKNYIKCLLIKTLLTIIKRHIVSTKGTSH